MKARYGMPFIAIAGLLGGALTGCQREAAETTTAEQAPATGMEQAPAAGTEQAAAPATQPAPGTAQVAPEGAIKPESGQPVNDAWITFKVASTLYGSDRVEGDYDVDTRSGTVTLKGMVNNEAAKTSAAELARTIEGVTQVDNQLTVVAEPRQDVVQENDEQLKERINKVLDEDARFKDMNLDAEVTAGKVTLKGEVADPTMAYQALNTVAKLQGVNQVFSQITLKEQQQPGSM